MGARGTSRSDAPGATRARILALGLALWVIAIGAHALFSQRLETVAAMYAGLGASLPFPLRLHIFSARPLAWIAVPLVILAALWLRRRDPAGLGAAKLVSASGLVALVWTVVGLLLGLHMLAFDLIRALQ